MAPVKERTSKPELGLLLQVAVAKKSSLFARPPCHPDPPEHFSRLPSLERCGDRLGLVFAVFCALQEQPPPVPILLAQAASSASLVLSNTSCTEQVYFCGQSLILSCRASSIKLITKSHSCLLGRTI